MTRYYSGRMSAKIFGALLCAAAALPFPAVADTHPFVNRVIVQQALQNQMQNRLDVQQMQLQAQQDAVRASILSQTQQQILQLQYLLLQQQLQMMQLRRAPAPSSTFHKPHPHS